MRLSEAIKLGALTVPWSRSYKGCAIGCALVAIGRNHYHNQNLDVKDAEQESRVAWPFLDLQLVKHPLKDYSGTLRVVIGDLNGFYAPGAWTREQIADWVATIEPQEGESPMSDNESHEFIPSDDEPETVFIETGECFSCGETVIINESASCPACGEMWCYDCLD